MCIVRTVVGNSRQIIFKTGNFSTVKITHVLYVIVILCIPRHVVRVNKYLISYLHLDAEFCLL